MKKSIIIIVAILLPVRALMAQLWTANKGNGTYNNLLLYDEFSD